MSKPIQQHESIFIHFRKDTIAAIIILGMALIFIAIPVGALVTRIELPISIGVAFAVGWIYTLMGLLILVGSYTDLNKWCGGNL